MFADPPGLPVQVLHHRLGVAFLLEDRPWHVPALFVVMVLQVLLTFHKLLRISFLKQSLMIIQVLTLFKVKLHPRSFYRVLRQLSSDILLRPLVPSLLQLVLPVQEVLPPALNLMTTLSLSI